MKERFRSGALALLLATLGCGGTSITASDLRGHAGGRSNGGAVGVSGIGGAGAPFAGGGGARALGAGGIAAAQAGNGGAGAGRDGTGEAGSGARKMSADAGGRAGSSNVVQSGAPATGGVAGGTSASVAGAAADPDGGTVFSIDSMPCEVAAADWCQELETGAFESANFIALTSDGDVILTGYEESTALTQKRDVAVARYKLDGTLVWVQRFGSEYDDYAEGVAVDADDDIFVVGDSIDSEGTGEVGGAFIAKLSSAGELSWSRTPGAPDYYRAAAVAVDGAGNSVLLKQTGYVMKYSPSGEELWTTHVEATMGGVAVDATGNVFVVGTTPSAATLTRLSASGAVVWNKPLGSTYPVLYRMALDRNGELVILSGGGLARYSATGDEIWSTAIGQEFYTGDNLALDGNGNVFVVGMAENFGKPYYDTYVARFASDGTRTWGEELGARMGSRARAVAASATGQVFITGPYAAPPEQPTNGAILVRVTP